MRGTAITFLAFCAWQLPEPPRAPPHVNAPVSAVLGDEPLVAQSVVYTGTPLRSEWPMLRAVRDLVADRFDLFALPAGTPITLWRAGDLLIGVRVHRAVEDGGVLTLHKAVVDGEETWVDHEGETLQGPVRSRPTPYVAISSRVGMRDHPIRKRSRFHAGTDYAAPVGTPIFAIADGVVQKAAYSWTGGRYLVIRHDLGFETKLFHLHRRLKSEGQRVRKGEMVGLVGKSGRFVTGPHLHFELRDRQNVPVDAAMAQWPGRARLDDDAVRTLNLRARWLDNATATPQVAIALAPYDVTPRGLEPMPAPASRTTATLLPPLLVQRAEPPRARLTPPPRRRRRQKPAPHHDRQAHKRAAAAAAVEVLVGADAPLASRQPAPLLASTANPRVG